MLELLFLLLPIAAGYGWYMGRRSIRQNHSNQQKKISKDYFTGLNFLLSNESDKAVDLFISLLEVDNETMDTHLSLGALFRKRGEVDRAIRIHQNLIARPNLPDDQRDQAMMELGKDYLAAGFYDRAEKVFASLIRQSEYSEEAEDLLIDIYQVTKEWQKALNIIKHMARKRQQALRSVCAHYYCQLADETSAVSHKIKLFHSALKQDAACGRALLELAEIYLSQNNFKSCKQVFMDLLEADIQLLPDGLDMAREIYQQSHDMSGYQKFLTQAVEHGAGASIINELAGLLETEKKPKQAENLVLNALYRHPTMKGFQHLMHIHMGQAEDGQAKQSLTMLEHLVEQQIKHRPSYRCNKCGFSSYSLYWHCPSCKNWGSIKRIQGLDGE